MRNIVENLAVTVFQLCSANLCQKITVSTSAVTVRSQKKVSVERDRSGNMVIAVY
jgi:hypothetical protein